MCDKQKYDRYMRGITNTSDKLSRKQNLMLNNVLLQKSAQRTRIRTFCLPGRALIHYATSAV